MSEYRIPDAAALKAMIGMIIDNDTQAELKDGDSMDASHVAIFNDADGNIAALCACDLSLAASVGCALSLIPPPTAADMAKSGALNEMAEGNLYEVMNMFSSLFMDDKSSHLKLTSVVPAGEAPTLEGDPRTALFSLSGGKYAGGMVSFTTH
ncbi:MAG: hypothetical protein AB8G16_12360 [Gammaproteobacteria bacterium]